MDVSTNCITCASGYYKEVAAPGSCVRCEAKMPDCTVCIYLNNRVSCLNLEYPCPSQLSAGVIAGIVVTAVVIVGGVIVFIF